MALAEVTAGLLHGTSLLTDFIESILRAIKKVKDLPVSFRADTPAARATNLIDRISHNKDLISQRAIFGVQRHPGFGHIGEHKQARPFAAVGVAMSGTAATGAGTGVGAEPQAAVKLRSTSSTNR